MNGGGLVLCEWSRLVLKHRLLALKKGLFETRVPPWIWCVYEAKPPPMLTAALDAEASKESSLSYEITYMQSLIKNDTEELIWKFVWTEAGITDMGKGTFQTQTTCRNIKSVPNACHVQIFLQYSCGGGKKTQITTHELDWKINSISPRPIKLVSMVGLDLFQKTLFFKKKKNIYVYIYIKCYGSMVYLQYCTSFTAKWMSYPYKHKHSLPM